MTVIHEARFLQRASRDLSFPFSLSMGSEEPPLILTKSLRHLPGKRLTVLAHWQGKEVVAKLFFHPKWAAYYGEKDAKGVFQLMRASIPTATLQFAGMSGVEGVFVVILNYLEDALSLQAKLLTASLEEKFFLWKDTVTLLGRLHEKRLIHKDFHGGNVLFQHQRAYVIDGAEIVKINSSLPMKKRLNDLAQCLVQEKDYVFLKKQWRSLLKEYMAATHLSFTDNEFNSMEKYLASAEKKKNIKRKKKILRDCTEFLVISKRNHEFVCDRTLYDEELKNILVNPAMCFIKPHRVLKAGNTATVIAFPFKGRSLVLKRYNVKSFWHGVRRGFKSSRALRSWYYAHRLREQGILTPRPVAFIETRKQGWLREAYYLSEYCEGVSILEAMKAPIPFQKELIHQLKNLLERLSLSKLSHGDMKSTNFLVTQKGLCLLDLDSMKEFDTLKGTKRALQKDTTRFLQNWEHDKDFYHMLKSEMNS